MGLFDYFKPNPPIGCAQPGCAGTLSGWQGKHQGHCLFVWREGRLDPEDQSASEDCKLPPERLAQIRLPAEAVIRLGWAECETCAHRSRFSIECLTDSQGLWFKTRITGKVAGGKLIEDDWLQCMKCFDAFPLVGGKSVYCCPTCESIIQR